jgi:phosphoribosylformimino-5-aminoimidazole carboxamide ribotide isomerase
MGGQVVRGVAGKRSEYRPVQSLITPTAQPSDVAAALAERFGFEEAYVADLDAIAGGEPDWNSYEVISTAGLKIWLDAGIGDISRARRLLEHDRADLARLIVGLESVSGPDVVTELVALCGAERLVFSLDLKAGVPLTSAVAWHGWPPEEIAAAAVVDSGITSMILLDLAQVGMYSGTGTESLCRALREQYPHLQLIGGGGVRSREDFARHAAAGFDRVLVASALHDGRLTRDDLTG